MHVLGGLLQEHLPELNTHLQSLHASWDMFTSKLVMTLCAAYIPLDCLAYIYDIFFMVPRCLTCRTGGSDCTR